MVVDIVSTKDLDPLATSALVHMHLLEATVRWL